jgi:hypothetical protein
MAEVHPNGIFYHCPASDVRISCFVCLYRCKPLRRRRCTTYAAHYPTLSTLQIPETYLRKYGVPELLVPYALTKRKRK